MSFSWEVRVFGEGSFREGFQQCWTEGRSSTAVAEDLRPTATATVDEV